MSEALKIAQHYFDLSNKRDIDAIEKMLDERSTYSSDNTGLYLGKDNIIKMKCAFFGSFEKMQWIVHSCEEIKENIVRFDFTFKGVKLNKEKIVRSGIEHVVIYNGKLQHIEVRNSD